MKCPICNGKGTQFIADYDGMYDIVCEQCKGKGEVDENGKPIFTNEEYLRSCTTEQLAEWMASVVQKAISIKESNSIVMLESAIWWEEWLKQPHQ